MRKIESKCHNNKAIHSRQHFQAKCGANVDKYVEYDFVMLLLDVLLHKVQAFRHLLSNRRINSSVRNRKIVVAVLICSSFFTRAILSFGQCQFFAQPVTSFDQCPLFLAHFFYTDVKYIPLKMQQKPSVLVKFIFSNGMPEFDFCLAICFTILGMQQENVDAFIYSFSYRNTNFCCHHNSDRQNSTKKSPVLIITLIFCSIDHSKVSSSVSFSWVSWFLLSGYGRLLAIPVALWAKETSVLYWLPTMLTFTSTLQTIRGRYSTVDVDEIIFILFYSVSFTVTFLQAALVTLAAISSEHVVQWTVQKKVLYS